MRQLTSIQAFAILASASLLAQAAHGRSLDEVLASKTLDVVTTASSPPHGFMDPSSNTLQGIMVDLAQGIGKHMGVAVKLTDVPFDGLIPTLTSGRADLMSAPLFVTDDRSKVVDFSAPVYGWGEGVVVSDKQGKHFSRLEDFRGEKVGTLVDSVQYKMIKDLPGTQVSTYPDYFSLLADIRAGRVDLGVVDPPSVLYQIRLKSIPGVKIDQAYQPKKRWYVAAAVQKNNLPLLDAVNRAIATMKQDGELHAILTKWGVADLEAK
jgi:polar amino acid transport system substrate-binding protein